MHRKPPSPPLSGGKPPRPPPLSVSIPTRPEPEPTPKPYPDDSPHSPLNSESPLRSDDPDPKTPTKNDAVSVSAGSIVAVEKYYSPLTSPLPVTPPMDSTTPDSFPVPPPHHHQHHIISFNRMEEIPPQTGVVYGGGERKGRVGFGFGIGRDKREDMVKKLGLGIRVLEIVFCLVSFSVMASDKTQGWSGDSFDRYHEYRYCLTVTIMGFVCSGFQAYDLAYHLSSGKHVISHHLRYQFDFIVDQILSYLLISASSAAATRVNDWVSNWGKDAFTAKASASISMAFLAFICFAISSLISGYNLCNRDIS